MSVRIEQITKTFNGYKALNAIDLEVKTGELVALLGPSGCGKTTLLRIIAGLERADSGKVLIRDEDVANTKVKDREVGFVFQHYALFRHMTVFENVAFGLTVRPKKVKPSDAEIKRRVIRLLRLVRLKGLAGRYPGELSGGQRQRVALARALAIEPRLLLLDEPFGALDAKVRKELRQWLRELHERLQMTTIFVTHDQEEALELADRIVVMNRGQVEQMGTPEEVYHHPKNQFVYNFLGNVNLFSCRLDGDKIVIGDTGIEVGRRGEFGNSVNPKISIRPHMLEITRLESAGSFKARIKNLYTAGPLVRVELTSHWGELFYVELPQDQFRVLDIKKGEEVFVSPKDKQVFISDYSI